MTLLDAYLRRAGSMSLTELSEKVGVSKARISQLRGKAEVPPDMALKIEKATDGALNAATLSQVIADARKGLAA